MVVQPARGDEGYDAGQQRGGGMQRPGNGPAAQHKHQPRVHAELHGRALGGNQQPQPGQGVRGHVEHGREQREPHEGDEPGDAPEEERGQAVVRIRLLEHHSGRHIAQLEQLDKHPGGRLERAQASAITLRHYGHLIAMGPQETSHVEGDAHVAHLERSGQPGGKRFAPSDPLIQAGNLSLRNVNVRRNTPL